MHQTTYRLRNVSTNQCCVRGAHQGGALRCCHRDGRLLTHAGHKQAHNGQRRLSAGSCSASNDRAIKLYSCSRCDLVTQRQQSPAVCLDVATVASACTAVRHDGSRGSLHDAHQQINREFELSRLDGRGQAYSQQIAKPPPDLRCNRRGLWLCCGRIA